MSLELHNGWNYRDDGGSNRCKRKISELSRERKRQMTENYRKQYNSTKSRKIVDTPVYLMSLTLLDHDTEANLQQKEYDDYATRQETEEGIYIPYNKDETNKTRKLLCL